jgi:hypothetical protein
MIPTSAPTTTPPAVVKLKAPQLNLRYLMITRRYLVWSVGLGIVAVGLLFFAFTSQLQSILTARATMSREQKKLDQLQRKNLELQQLTSSPAFSQISTVNLVLPSRKPLIELLNGLNGAVFNSGVFVTSIELSPGKIASASADGTEIKQPDEIPSDKDYAVVDVSLTARGPLPKINAFFESIEQIAPLTTVTGLSLSKQGRASNQTEDEFEAKLSITTYYFVKSIAAALETPLPVLGAEEEKALKDIATFTSGEEAPQTSIQGGGIQDLFGAEALQRELTR